MSTQSAHNPAPEKAQTWVFGDEAACRYLASVSWPWEREENRDAWAVTMLHRPDLLAREIEAARERLESAIGALSGYCFPPEGSTGGVSEC